MHGQEGFTLVELMVAALVLVVGMLATLSVLNTGLSKTTLNAQRVAATNLARELTETARQVTYANLDPSTVRAALQAAGSDLGTGTGAWTVKRRATTYTIAASVCTYDDPADKLAASPPANVCPTEPGTATTTGDANGDDFRRVTFDVSWLNRGQTQTFRQTALVVNPSGGLGPRITNFPSITTTLGPSDTLAQFSVDTTYAGAVHWNVDDGKTSGDATMISGYRNWKISWDLKNVLATGAVLDGTYSVIAQAFDDRGIAGDAKVATVTINRSNPFAPAGFRGGHDTRAGDWVDLEWSLNQERDILGYRVYWAGPDKAVGGGDDVRVCPSDASVPFTGGSTTSCQDFSPPPGSATYYIVAVDTKLDGTYREGAPTLLSVGSPGGRLNPVQLLQISGIGEPTLTWTAPNGGSVAFYRIYRDGTEPKDRIARVTTTTYTDVGGGGSHTYYVSAVDAKFNESDLVAIPWNG
jgi:prepilin-type N-terminal cleavage/methylation domain-containing protein